MESANIAALVEKVWDAKFYIILAGTILLVAFVLLAQFFLGALIGDLREKTAELRRIGIFGRRRVVGRRLPKRPDYMVHLGCTGRRR